MFYLVGDQIPQINAVRLWEQCWEWTGSLWNWGSAISLNSSYNRISFHTSIANSFNSAFFWIDSISPTAKPICLKRKLFFQGENFTVILGLKSYQVMRKISIEKAQRRNFNFLPSSFYFLLEMVDIHCNRSRDVFFCKHDRSVGLHMTTNGKSKILCETTSASDHNRYEACSHANHSIKERMEGTVKFQIYGDNKLTAF